MPVEMIGWVTSQVESEIFSTRQPVYDHNAISNAAKIHEESGFDRALVGYFSDAPDGFMVAAHASAVTERLGFLMAHRPGFISPTVAARKFASLDHLTRGRAAIHLIAGGSTVEQAMDGDFLEHDARYQRMKEYIQLMQRTWNEVAPFDHTGRFYKVVQAHSKVRCLQSPRMPIFGGGGSKAAIDVLAPIVDVFMLWGESLADTAAFMQRVRAASGSTREKPITFSVSTRPILGCTEEHAWSRAHEFLCRAKKLRAGSTDAAPENVGTQRLLRLADKGAVHDRCLWTELAASTGAHGNSTALVGTAETVAGALFEYYKLGATRLLIRGFDPLFDAQDYGRELIPRLRKLVSNYDRAITEKGGDL